MQFCKKDFKLFLFFLNLIPSLWHHNRKNSCSVNSNTFKLHLLRHQTTPNWQDFSPKDTSYQSVSDESKSLDEKTFYNFGEEFGNPVKNVYSTAGVRVEKTEVANKKFQSSRYAIMTKINLLPVHETLNTLTREIEAQNLE